MEIYGYFSFDTDSGYRLFFFGTRKGILADTKDGIEFGWDKLSNFREATEEYVLSVTPDEMGRKAVVYALGNGNPGRSFKLFDTPLSKEKEIFDDNDAF